MKTISSRGCALALAGLVCTSLLAACATERPAIDQLSRGQARGDADQVSVEGGRFSALPLAIAHCSRFNRSAQFIRSEGDRSIYRCVVKGN